LITLSAGAVDTLLARLLVAFDSQSLATPNSTAIWEIRIDGADLSARVLPGWRSRLRVLRAFGVPCRYYLFVRNAFRRTL